MMVGRVVVGKEGGMRGVVRKLVGVVGGRSGVGGVGGVGG